MLASKPKREHTTQDILQELYQPCEENFCNGGFGRDSFGNVVLGSTQLADFSTDFSADCGADSSANLPKMPNNHPKRTSTLIQSPLNYTGSKFRLLPQILPLFPKDIGTMVDLFCGGASVGINVSAKHIVLNDRLKELVEILALLKRESIESLLAQIEGIIIDFHLSQSTKFGYKFYHCDSAKGLSRYNKAGFSHLKNAYNSDKDALKLFVLIIYAFNNQIRFNSKGEFNLPCGKRDFNAKMQQKLKDFVQAMQSKNISLQSRDFREFDSGILDKQSLVYIDPPYLLANAGYNENGGGGETDEKDLLHFIKALDCRGVKFALSNVLFHKGREHKILATWLKSNPKFHTHFLDFSYKNCNYQTKRAESSEVLVVNFKV